MFSELQLAFIKMITVYFSLMPLEMFMIIFFFEETSKKKRKKQQFSCALRKFKSPRLNYKSQLPERNEKQSSLE